MNASLRAKRLAVGLAVTFLLVGCASGATAPPPSSIAATAASLTAVVATPIPAHTSSPVPSATPVVAGPRAPSWTATGSLGTARAVHTAVLLRDGRVLVVGGLSRLCYCAQGPLASAELYDPASGSWTATGKMVTHSGVVGTLTRLLDGRVLAAGDGTSELYDPATGTWTATGKMVISNASYNATVLPDGRVLVAGGGGGGSVTCDGCAPLASAELYDPASGTWTAAANMTRPRSGPTATLLPDGRVLVAGGDPPTDQPGPPGPSTAELYDPVTESWTATGSMVTPGGSGTATLLRDGRVLVTSAGAAAAELYDPASGTWTATGKMVADSGGGTATLLRDGRVLVVARGTSAELYAPGSRTWTATASMTTTRTGGTATLLQDGRVLVAGGAWGFVANVTNYSGATTSAELYDPGSPGASQHPIEPTIPSAGPSLSVVQPRAPSWTPTGRMISPHSGATATMLPDGKVLVAGGSDSAELYDPRSGTWTATGPMVTLHGEGQTATLLPDGKVLVAGGMEGGDAAELYEPASRTWAATGRMTEARVYSTATLLPDGKVLVAGGFDFAAARSPAGGSGFLASAELYDPSSGRWSVAARMIEPREGHTATLLRDGRVLVAGGYDFGRGALTSAELYDPNSGSWMATGAMVEALVGEGYPGGTPHTATLLPDGKVLVAGTVDPSNTHGRGFAQLYDPGSGTWTATGEMIEAREDHTATLLRDGKVLVAGGLTHAIAGGGDGDVLAAAELYDPSSGTWSATRSMGTPRGGATSTLLPNGTVLVAGGEPGTRPSAELYGN